MYVSGFPKKACQGCHISEGAGRIIFQLVSFYALGSKSMETKVKCFVNTIRELFPSRHFVLVDLWLMLSPQVKTEHLVIHNFRKYYQHVFHVIFRH